MHPPGEQRMQAMNEQNDCVVRRLQQSDVHAVLEIISASRREYGLESRVAALLEPSEYRLFDLYQHRRSVYFVALSGDEIVGGAGIAPLANSDWATCELQKMYLRPRNRGRGIGRQLLSACIGAAQSLGFTRCYAETILAMTAALAFYERSGFRRLTSPVGLTGHTHNDCWMTLEIQPPGFANRAKV